MRILYSICGEGRGHINRSLPIVKELSKKHSVKILSNKKAYGSFKDYDFELIDSFHICYKDNNVSNIGTLFLNLKNLGNLMRSFFKVYGVIKRFKPDVIISDFEIFSSYWANLLGIKLISIDNQHVLRKTKIKVPLRYYLTYLKSRAVIVLYVPKADRYFATTFFYPKLRGGEIELFPPILREEILALKPRDEDFILVYQTSKSYKKLFSVLKKIDHRFIVYNFDKDLIDENIEFKKDGNEFLQDLADCKAVILNGGFTLMSEALYLGKPVLSIPVGRQFEQICNSLYLEKLGYGMRCDELSLDILKKFISNLDVYRENLKRFKRESNKRLFRRLEKILEQKNYKKIRN